MQIEELTLSDWENELPPTGFDVFHMPEVLRILDKYTPGELRIYGGFQGEELIGILPVFVREKFVAKAIISPPPGFSVPRMGPLVMSPSPKRCKQEKQNRRFTENVLEALDADSSLSLIAMVCSPDYGDPRPFSWAGYDVDTRFTYCLDLKDADKDEILLSFDRKLRSEIRKGVKLDIEVIVDGPNATEQIYDAYEARFNEQGANFPTPRDYVVELVETLGDRARTYVAQTLDGEFIGGIIVLYSNDVAFSWLGGMRAVHEGVSVNSLLDWHIIGDILTDPLFESVDSYDFGNANDERLSGYKRKYSPELLPYYEVKSGKAVALAKEIYLQVTY